MVNEAAGGDPDRSDGRFHATARHRFMRGKGFHDRTTESARLNALLYGHDQVGRLAVASNHGVIKWARPNGVHERDRNSLSPQARGNRGDALNDWTKGQDCDLASLFEDLRDAHRQDARRNFGHAYNTVAWIVKGEWVILRQCGAHE